MAESIKLSTRGLLQIEKTLKELSRRVTHLKVPFSAIGALALTRTHESFENEESPAGESWQALSPGYVERPKNKGGRGGADHPILFREGHLEASIQYHAGDTYVEVGTNRKFPGGEDSAAASHRVGGRAGRGGAAEIPARPFLGLTDEDDERAAGILMDYLSNT
jgi:phage virion morphogenesis protein